MARHNHGRAGVMMRGWHPGMKAREIWRKRGGGTGTGNSGPSGYKLRPGPLTARRLADMAAGYGVVNGVKKKGVRSRADVANAARAKAAKEAGK